MARQPKDPIKALAAPGGVTRRKVNRGSTRRINRALEKVLVDLRAFRDEIDTQAFVTDRSGKRTGSVKIVEDIDRLRAELPAIVAEFTTPPAPEPKPEPEKTDE